MKEYSELIRESRLWIALGQGCNRENDLVIEHDFNMVKFELPETLSNTQGNAIWFYLNKLALTDTMSKERMINASDLNSIVVGAVPFNKIYSNTGEILNATLENYKKINIYGYGENLKSKYSDISEEDFIKCRKDTLEHIENVKRLLMKFSERIITRGIEHDKSKLEPPELDTFAIYGKKLASTTYMSDEYKQFLKEMKPALDHHYSSNRHHPEHFDNGLDGMNLIDIIELFFDWKAASMRHNDGNLAESITKNKKRFNMSQQLVNIFLNTDEEFK